MDSALRPDSDSEPAAHASDARMAWRAWLAPLLSVVAFTLVAAVLHRCSWRIRCTRSSTTCGDPGRRWRSPRC